jgi:hypothetical protein
VRNEDGSKWLTAGRLKALLGELPDDCRIVPNRVGNLAIVSADGETFEGFIDFLLDGEIER